MKADINYLKNWACLFKIKYKIWQKYLVLLSLKKSKNIQSDRGIDAIFAEEPGAICEDLVFAECVLGSWR